jgi:rfaE bifunctional protein nucleotidyltransferase chain/domain
MIYCFDIDGTICTISKKYTEAKPIKHIIDKVNDLYDKGHTIKIFTARGQATGWNYKELTEKQLKEWNVKYHQLIMGKPSADLYIDDKTVTPNYFKAPLVFTNGCFDIIHAGHIKLLREASIYGNVVVGLNSDKSISRIKEGRPFNDLHTRWTVLSSIRYVWHIVPFDEDTPEKLIKELKPDVLVKGADWKGKLPEAKIVEAYGGEVVFVDLLKGFSTTKILQSHLY